MKKTLILFLAFFTLSVLNAQAAVYYSDQENPPTTDREPPFAITRKHWENHKTYLNIRFPYETKEGVVFLFSMGNELETLMTYQVKKLELKYGNKKLDLLPSYYNYDLKKQESGMKNLLKYKHPMPPNLHRRVQVICKECEPSMKELTLELEIEVLYDDQKDLITDKIELFQGTYHEPR